MRARVSVTAALLALSGICSACVGKAEPFRRIGELNLRALAVYVVAPVYPANLASTGTEGVAVSEIEISSDGFVRKVGILEAPHPEIAAAVEVALRQWRFNLPPLPGPPARVPARGKLTYYFVVRSGRGAVLAPSERGAQSSPLRP